MRVILNTTISGTRNGEDWPARGSEIDLPDAEAVDMLNAGTASPAGDALEVATAPAVESATTPKAKRR